MNNNPEQKASRWVINFFDWSEDKARSYPDCFDIVERLVKPERQRWKKDKDGFEIVGTYALRKPLPQKWWIYGEKRPALYETISKLDHVMVVARISKTLAMTFVDRKTVFADALVVFNNQSFSIFCIMQSTIHNIWAWKYCTTMKSDLNYTPGNVFETFPFPKINTSELDHLGAAYFKLRKDIMNSTKIGLTKIYNRFHDSVLKALSDHTLSEIEELRSLHVKMDFAVLQSYGWADINLQHGFYELEYLPENDRIRFTIHSAARKEILKRLLKLNKQLYSVEKVENSEPKGNIKRNLKNSADGNTATLF